MEATGRRISQLRTEKGLSVKDIQQYMGFDAPQAVYKRQSGTALPSVDNLLALSTLLDIPMNANLVTMPPDEPEGSFFMRFFQFFGQKTGRALSVPCLS